MKKQNSNGKLFLRKSSIAKLNAKQLHQIDGGYQSGEDCNNSSRICEIIETLRTITRY